jgi:hypothetical protein
MDITLNGLTRLQQLFCQIIWQMENKTRVDIFIASLLPEHQQQCQLLIQLMQLEITDQIDSVDLAVSVLAKYRL